MEHCRQCGRVEGSSGTEYLERYDQPLVWVTLLWLFTIVVMPFPTELLGTEWSGRTVPAFSIGTLLASSACLSATAALVLRRPHLQREGFAPPTSRRSAARSGTCRR